MNFIILVFFKYRFYELIFLNKVNIYRESLYIYIYKNKKYIIYIENNFTLNIIQ